MSIENKLIKMVLEIINDKKDILLERGIINSLPQIDKKSTSLDGRNSEFRLFFSTKDDFIDGIEFFLYKNGKPVCSVNDMSDFIEKEIDRIIKNRH